MARDRWPPDEHEHLIAASELEKLREALPPKKVKQTHRELGRGVLVAKRLRYWDRYHCRVAFKRKPIPFASGASSELGQHNFNFLWASRCQTVEILSSARIVVITSLRWTIRRNTGRSASRTSPRPPHQTPPGPARCTARCTCCWCGQRASWRSEYLSPQPYAKRCV